MEKLYVYHQTWKITSLFSIGGVTFKDSLSFTQQSLDKLVKNLQEGSLKKHANTGRLLQTEKRLVVIPFLHIITSYYTYINSLSCHA